MADSNELLHDALVRRQIYLQRFSRGVTTRVQGLLDATEADLTATLKARLEKMAAQGVDFGPHTTTRLKVLRGLIQEIRGGAWDDIKAGEWGLDLKKLAVDERNFIDEAVNDYSPVILDTTLPSALELAKIATSRPFQGKVMRAWARKLESDDTERIMQQIHIGLVQGDTPSAMARRVVGTYDLDGTDGVTEITRRNAEAITRTAVNHISNEARAIWMEANDDVISKERFTATLDSRTTPECAALDGSVYDVGEGPIPPLHWNCRSVRVPVIDGKIIGDRPAKNYNEDDLEGLNKTERRAKVRELTGQVPAETTYSDFLGRQTNSFQEDVLGVSRAKLFRDGDLTLDKFVDSKGKLYDLDTLRRREPSAFRRADI